MLSVADGRSLWNVSVAVLVLFLYGRIDLYALARRGGEYCKAFRQVENAELMNSMFAENKIKLQQIAYYREFTPKKCKNKWIGQHQREMFGWVVSVSTGS